MSVSSSLKPRIVPDGDKMTRDDYHYRGRGGGRINQPLYPGESDAGLVGSTIPDIAAQDIAASQISAPQ